MVELKKIAITGASGMLGSMILDVLSSEPDVQLICTVRTEALADEGRSKYENVDWRVLDARDGSFNDVKKAISGSSYVINAIGIIKPYVHDDKPEEVERATKVNSLFPHSLGRAAAEIDAKVLQIATDCVYSGNKGEYLETDPHDALDVYGKTKSLGEVFLPNVFNMRCSIIGPEQKNNLSLLEWFLRQPKNARVNGYTNHSWNGVTTYHYARMCLGIVKKDTTLPHIQHIVPRDVIQKSEMLQIFAREFNRSDIQIMPSEAKVPIDRTLLTNNNALNLELWSGAGYNEPPSIEQMIAKLAEYMGRKA